METLLNVEFDILNCIQEVIRCPFWDIFFVACTHLGDFGIVWIVTAIALLCFKKTRKTGICVGVALLIGVLLVLILKPIATRERPFSYFSALMSREDIEKLISAPNDFSFPSGHTLSSFGAATAIFINNNKYGIFAYILAAMIAFSRMYLYVHFPTDILSGMLLGIGVGFLSFYLVKRFSPYFQKKIS